MNAFSFTLLQKDTQTHARVGIIHTPHGDIETPAFVPVGTQASVKSLTPSELTDLDVHLFFVNTYHMAMRPGFSIIEKAGGIHTFMGWDRPIITDSGGFQVFSLGRNKYTHLIQKSNIETRYQTTLMDQNETPTLVNISDDGVVFRSHWDGAEHVFTPESSMQNQWRLGSDIHIAFDDCTPYPVTPQEARKSMERTHRWAVRSLSENQKLTIKNQTLGHLYQALYGSVQGSVYEDLRKESAKFIMSLPFDGFAVGGVSVGESKEEMVRVMDWVSPYLPDDKPRHLLGVGEIDDIFALIEHGFDTFDCVQPTRLARMGRVYLKSDKSTNPTNTTNMKKYEIDIVRAAYAGDMAPIESGCPCYTCTHFSRAYIHHLFKVRELLGYRLASIHNISFINRLVNDIRLAIRDGSLVALKKQYLNF